MSELRDLYQEMILDHSKRPRNFGPLEHANHSAEGYNPLCGDKIDVHLILDGDIVKDVHFEGIGCAISTASASLMTEAVKGMTRKDAEDLFTLFQDMVTGKVSAEEHEETLGKLVALAGVREFPMRVKCATLAWHTMQAAIDNEEDPVTTE